MASSHVEVSGYSPPARSLREAGAFWRLVAYEGDELGQVLEQLELLEQVLVQSLTVTAALGSRYLLQRA